MIIKNKNEVPFEDTKGYNRVIKQIFIGPKDGSNEIIMRYFSVSPGGATPYHKHDFPHLVKIEKGEGIAIDADKKEYKVEKGQLIYIHDNEIHGFKNTSTEAFEFICIVPERGEK
ncbi:MAG: cupin domain-containing protein [Bacteroidales bacterium]|nr:cupin domain-containing protein [Bacteroidales bacterium]